MIQKYLILIDERSQHAELEKIKSLLRISEIDLVYKEYNPTDFQKRENNGDVLFDKDSFIKALKRVPYFKQLDSIACDFNLIEDVINGFEIIKIIKEINPYYKKQTILYSAQIDDVINKIIKEGSFDFQKENLKKLIDCNIEFIKRDGYDQEVIKHIKKDKPFSFEDELIKWFYSRDNDEFNFIFEKYKSHKFKEIAECLEKNTADSIKFKKELVEQIIAYLSKINDLN